MFPTYQYILLYYKAKDIGYFEPSEIRAIIPPALAPNVKFDITSAMIQMLNLKDIFLRFATYDVNMHLANFSRICTSHNILSIDPEAWRLRLFLFSLTRETSLCLGELSRGLIMTWNELRR